MSYYLNYQSEKERIDFIVNYNHNNGYQIHEIMEENKIWALLPNEIWDEGQNGPIVDSTYEQRMLDQAKNNKLAENIKKRDERLNAGIMYKNILFDSDTDQKVNLIAMASFMSDDDTIIWLGKDNQPLNCTKEDLLNIGNLIVQLTSAIWGSNGLNQYYISAINDCTTIVQVNNIVIDYDNIQNPLLLLNNN
ncbi:MAG: hypothetical protein BHW64_03290 [Candidatus Melainabacteria bacterium LEY3_CP_29_8]|nr:MAG: hypothetical protein BHW64_03290 [Candidatus Melainabacteria bacterium LEY3_CP_29_8]